MASVASVSLKCVLSDPVQSSLYTVSIGIAELLDFPPSGHVVGNAAKNARTFLVVCSFQPVTGQFLRIPTNCRDGSARKAVKRILIRVDVAVDIPRERRQKLSVIVPKLPVKIWCEISLIEIVEHERRFKLFDQRPNNHKMVSKPHLYVADFTDDLQSLSKLFAFSNFCLNATIFHLVEGNPKGCKGGDDGEDGEEQRQPCDQRSASFSEQQAFQPQERKYCSKENAAEGNKCQRHNPASIFPHFLLRTLTRFAPHQPTDVGHG